MFSQMLQWSMADPRRTRMRFVKNSYTARLPKDFINFAKTARNLQIIIAIVDVNWNEMLGGIKIHSAYKQLEFVSIEAQKRWVKKSDSA